MITLQCPNCRKNRIIWKRNFLISIKRAKAKNKMGGLCRSCYLKTVPKGKSCNLFKRGFSVDTRGYIYITISMLEDPKLIEMCKQSILNRSYGKNRSGRIYKHHIEMIKALNRPLQKGEVVHHKDGNPENPSHGRGAQCDGS